MIDNNIIVGAMLVSRNPELLDYTIPNMAEWCDWWIVVLDNEDEETTEKVLEYQKKYYDRMFVRRSSVPSRLISRGGKELSYHERWKSCKGVIRNDVFVNLRCILDWKKPGYDKIDVLLFYDHDVIFTNYLPELLERFIASDKKAITMKHVSIINDFQTAVQDNIGHHIHIMKWDRNLAGLPRRFYALYYPLEKKDLMPAEYYSVHLAYLTEENREWRNRFWKKDNVMENKFYKLPKDVEQMRPEEIKEILK